MNESAFTSNIVIKIVATIPGFTVGDYFLGKKSNEQTTKQFLKLKENLHLAFQI